MALRAAALTEMDMKRNFVLDRLKEQKVTHSQQGRPIEELEYDELKYELVLAGFRQVDVSTNASQWF